MTTQTLPPVQRLNAFQWLRVNLFSNWWNSLLTVLASLIIYYLARGILVWAFTQAEWEVIPANLQLFLVGQYPADQLWRVWTSIVLFAFLSGSSLALWSERLRGLAISMGALPLLLAALPFSTEARLWLVSITAIGFIGWKMGRGANSAMRKALFWGWLLWIPVFVLLLAGVSEGGILPQVETNVWGGLLLTMLLTIVGIVASFPLGVALALGRRSELPIVRWFSIAYIELIRGVPLVTILFMAQLMLPLFLPPNVTLDRVLRAQVGIILFSAAYLAENVRGGLQAIPKGQYEASYALGLNPFQTTMFIILPQALRLSIPVLVGQFIGFFKDTSLVAIVGLFDLLGIAKTVLAQPDYMGLQREVYAFISIFYWGVSYLMSYVSLRVEEALGLGKR